MKTLLCHDFLTEQEHEGLIDPSRTRTIDGTSGTHIECEAGHRFHLGSDDQQWPCDCEMPDK